MVDSLRDPETGDYWQCEHCRQYLDADGTCPEGCPPTERRRPRFVRVTKWSHRWHEVSWPVKVYRWVKFILPARLYIWIRTTWWRLRGLPEAPEDEADIWQGDRVRYAHHLLAVTLNMAWYKAGAYKATTELIDELKQRARDDSP